jgi:hypothetical protein
VKEDDMIDKNAALTIAVEEVRTRCNARDKYIVCDEMTMEFPFGWVFFWIPDPATGIDPSECFGNSPFIVDRRDGSVHLMGTREDAEVVAERYARTGSTEPAFSA